MLLVQYCKTWNFRLCNIFGISQNQRFSRAKISVNQFSRFKNAFCTLCGIALLNFRSRFILGKNGNKENGGAQVPTKPVFEQTDVHKVAPD